MDVLTVITVLVIALVILMFIAIFKEKRSIVIGITAIILILAIVQIIIKWGSAGFADYIIPVLCIAMLVYHWKFVKG